MEKWGVGADWDKSMRNSCVSPARDGEMSIQKEIDRTDRQTKVENHTFKQVEQRITKEAIRIKLLLKKTEQST